MGNDLLKQIKDLGYTHDQVAEILKAAREAEGKKEPESRETIEPTEPDKLEGKANDEVENENKDKPKPPEFDIEEIKKTLTEGLSKDIDEKVQEKLKELTGKLRNSPPTGNKSSETTNKDPFVGSRPYDVWV